MAPAGPPRRHRSKHLDEYLATHNRLADLTSFLIRMAIALGHRYTVEQPVSSLLFSYSPIACVAHNADSVSFCMGYFAGNTLKPLRIVGTASWLHVFATCICAGRRLVRSRRRSWRAPTSLASRASSASWTRAPPTLQCSGDVLPCATRALRLQRSWQRWSICHEKRSASDPHGNPTVTPTWTSHQLATHLSCKTFNSISKCPLSGFRSPFWLRIYRDAGFTSS